MALDELLKGMAVLDNGLKTFAVGQGIAQAQEQVNQLNSMQMKEMEKRAALSGIANNLVMQLSQAGADPAQVAQASGAIRPKELQNSADFLALGAQTGDAEVTGLGRKLQDEETRTQRNMQATSIEAQKWSQIYGAAHSEKLKDMEIDAQLQAAGVKGTKAKPGDVSFSTNVDMGLKLATELEQAVKRNGTWESRLGDTKDAAALEGIPYQLAITYAKIVDPESVAREGEVAAAQKYLIDLGMTASKSKALEQIKRMKSTIVEYARTRAKTQGREVPQGEAGGQQQQSTEPALPAGIPKGSVLTTRKTKDGKLMKVYKTPDGILYPAE